MDFLTGKSTERIFLHLSNATNEKLIRQYLSDQYKFVEEQTESALLKADYDLCILSISKFERYKELLAELKDKLYPVYFPVMLLLNEQQFEQNSSTLLGDICDDILSVPISPVLLKVRIKSLVKQRNASTSLQERIYLANKAIDATNIGVSITDQTQEDNPLIFVNKGFSDLTGYDDDEILGKNCRFLQNDDSDQEALYELREAIEKGLATKVVLRNYKKDGTAFWNELSISPIYDRAKDQKYFVGIQNDVTELIETRNELQELLDEKEVLLQEIHHRIKNNLAVIVALMELKIMESQNEETVTSLKQTRTRIFSISQVHELLYQQESLNEIDFKQYVEGLVTHLKTTYADDPKKVTFNLDLVPLALSLDQAVPCGMLLSELVTNAFKHGFRNQEEGEIHIYIFESEGWVHAEVTDNGEGLPADTKLEDTEKFSQSILNILLRQLEADWEYKSENGFQFKFSFKINDYTGIATDENVDKAAE